MAVDITIQASFLPRNDAEASLAFYRDTLGFEVRNDVGYGERRRITVGSTDQPGTYMVLYPPAADPSVTADERRATVEMMAKGTYAVILLAPTGQPVTDPGAARERHLQQLKAGTENRHGHED